MYEYKIIEIRLYEEMAEDDLNEMGRAGWRLAKILKQNLILFMREVNV